MMASPVDENLFGNVIFDVVDRNVKVGVGNIEREFTGLLVVGLVHVLAITLSGPPLLHVVEVR